MRNILLNSILLVALIFLASCEGNTDYVFSVKNNSTVNIKVWSYFFNNSLNTDTLSIAPGESRIIAQTSQLGGNKFSVPATSFVDSVDIFNSSNQKIPDSIVYQDGRWPEVI